jgi:hypothetical protein
MKKITPPQPEIFESLFCGIDLPNKIVDVASIKDRAIADGFHEQPNKHITILYTAKKLKNFIDKLGEEKIKQIILQAIEGLNWEYEEKEIYYIEKKSIFPGENQKEEYRQSYIRVIDQPDMAIFYERLSKKLGETIKPNFPHITLFSKGEGENPDYLGIGIPDYTDFQTLKPIKIN